MGMGSEMFGVGRWGCRGAFSRKFLGPDAAVVGGVVFACVGCGVVVESVYGCWYSLSVL